MYDALLKYGNILQYLLESSKVLMSEMHLLNLTLKELYTSNSLKLKMYL